MKKKNLKKLNETLADLAKFSKDLDNILNGKSKTATDGEFILFIDEILKLSIEAANDAHKCLSQGSEINFFHKRAYVKI